MARHFGISESGLRAGGDNHVSRSMREDTQRILEFHLSPHRAPFAQMMIDLAAVVSIVVLACVTGVGLAASFFILFCVHVH